MLFESFTAFFSPTSFWILWILSSQVQIKAAHRSAGNSLIEFFHERKCILQWKYCTNEVHDELLYFYSYSRKVNQNSISNWCILRLVVQFDECGLVLKILRSCFEFNFGHTYPQPSKGHCNRNKSPKNSPDEVWSLQVRVIHRGGIGIILNTHELINVVSTTVMASLVLNHTETLVIHLYEYNCQWKIEETPKDNALTCALNICSVNNQRWSQNKRKYWILVSTFTFLLHFNHDQVFCASMLGE